MNIKPGGIRLGQDAYSEITWKPEDFGLVATDGVQYTSVASFGSASVVNIIDELINPGFNMNLVKPTEIGLTQQFTGQNGSFVGSIFYYWRARSEYTDWAVGVPTLRTSEWINFTGTYRKGIGTLLASEDTFSGYIPIGSLPRIPARFRLNAIGIQSIVGIGRIKSSSYIKFVGNPIPGA